ncbi:hypothetical protein D3C85_1606140 [compost metagenome]
MRVAGVIEIRHRSGDMGHGHQADTQVRVGVHGYAQAKGLAHFRQRLSVAQTAPIVVIGEDNLHAVQCHTAAKLIEISDHHIGCQRQAGAFVQFGHTLQARRRVFVILQVIAEQFGHANRGCHGPVAVRIDP